MRTPLGNLRGSNEVALSRPRSSEEYQALLASNLEECDRLSRMIENVLFLARAEHPQFAKNMREFNVEKELIRITDYLEGVVDDAGFADPRAGQRPAYSGCRAVSAGSKQSAGQCSALYAAQWRDHAAGYE
jgi:hypothetical protein